MQNYWQKIKNKIDTEFEINYSNDWYSLGKKKLKILEAKLEKTIKDKIVQDLHIATEFLNKSVVTTFLDSKEEEKRTLIEKYIRSGEMGNPKVDIRTLEKFIIDEVIPTQQRIRNIFSIYALNLLYQDALAEFEMENNERPDKRISHSNYPKISIFFSTMWWVYYFHYDEARKIGLLGRAILEIKDDGNVYLKNVEHETATNFVGELQSEKSSQHLCINLLSEGTFEKHLRIVVFIGMGKIYPLLVGVYTNIYSNNSIVAGTVILEKAHFKSTQQEIPRFYTFQEALKEGIDRPIIEFLKNREQNFIKSPGGILTSQKLKSWLLDKKRIKT